MKLPLEELKEKYIPISEFPAKYGISVLRVLKLVNSGKIRKAEFKSPGDSRRTIHVNYEEVLALLKKEEEK